MKLVIQCAGRKDPGAGYFIDPNGRRIKFVAQPSQAPPDPTCNFVRPDDPSHQVGKTWRELVAGYNASYAASGANPFGLFPAYRLYSKSTYRELVERYGAGDIYILSAGWGLIRSDFLTPQYDITFNKSADPYTRRRERDPYRDFGHLPAGLKDEVVFFGGKDYLPLFCQLTNAIRSDRIVFYNSKTPPNAPGCRLVRYNTTKKTNWHYACVRDFIAGRVRLGPHKSHL